MSEGVVASRKVEIAVDHPAFDGHFPARPVLPGVALLAEVLEAALGEPALAACIGIEPRLAVVKFLAPVGPGAQLRLPRGLVAGDPAGCVVGGVAALPAGDVGLLRVSQHLGPLSAGRERERKRHAAERGTADHDFLPSAGARPLPGADGLP